MTRPLTNGYAPSLELIHPAIFASHMAKTTASVTYTFMHKARQKLNMDIQGGINSVMRAAKRSINLIYFIKPDVSTQYDWFAPKTAAGLTQAGLSRINQSIEAYVYCILGAQVNVRSSILGEGGRAKEAQTEFLTLMEDAIRQPDLAKSVQRYQLAVDQAKVRLNLAVCPGAWLMPARMVINTGSIVGYNNALKQAKAGMKLGINNDVNLGTKKAALQLMDGGPSKINAQANQNFTNTDNAFKLYNQAHPDYKLSMPTAPKFSDMYQPSELQKQGELLFVSGGALALAAFLFL